MGKCPPICGGSSPSRGDEVALFGAKVLDQRHSELHRGTTDNVITESRTDVTGWDNTPIIRRHRIQRLKGHSPLMTVLVLACCDANAEREVRHRKTVPRRLSETQFEEIQTNRDSK